MEDSLRIQFEALPTTAIRDLQSGGKDAYGNLPERKKADGSRIPCRHCLDLVAEGEDYLVVSYRPFETTQPYAETGPLFLHARRCERAAPTNQVPAMMNSPAYILRGYDIDERIIYDTGALVQTSEIARYAADLLRDSSVASVHVRSAHDTCYQCRITRA